MPVSSTIAAKAPFASVGGRTAQSTSMNSHSCGKIAATVIRPKGGSSAFLPIRSRTDLNHQKVIANSGCSKRTRTLPSTSQTCPAKTVKQSARLGNRHHDQTPNPTPDGTSTRHSRCDRPPFRISADPALAIGEAVASSAQPRANTFNQNGPGFRKLAQSAVCGAWGQTERFSSASRRRRVSLYSVDPP